MLRLLISILLFFSPLLAHAAPPNIVFLLADDLGYGDLGCYGQKRIATPNIDRLAKEGMRFTQAYAGSTVCAPSRCSLMTGKHTGHAVHRGNKYIPLTDTTVAELLKTAGYKTAVMGKWGLGEPGSEGVPSKRGFDAFYGYLNHHHAHNYYPDYLWRGDTKETLPGNIVIKDNVNSKRTTYAPDVILNESLTWLEKNKSGPFFLYHGFLFPHANNEKGRADGNGMEVPDAGIYAKEKWPQPQKNHAAMISYLDMQVGKILDKLKEIGAENNTLVLFSSDNGPHKEGGADPAFFQSWGPLRGFKRDLTEGGIRVPFIARWPGKVKAASVNDHVCAFWDFLPTAVELAGAKLPEKIDGVSLVPTLTGKGEQKAHAFLYWEFHERGSQFAVRHGNYKAIRPHLDAKLELYDLTKDLQEKNNIAESNPDVVNKIEEYLKTARTESKDWPLTRKPKGKK
jgi:arylsulfatase A-like enzyme